MESLSEVRLQKRKRGVNYNGVRDLLTNLKGILKKESDPTVRRNLAEAGMALSKILLK